MKIANLLQRWLPERTVSQQENIIKARAYSGRAELQHKSLILQVIVLLMGAYIFWQQYSWSQHANVLAERKWFAVKVYPDGSNAIGDISEFQTGPSDIEIRAEAWQLFRYIAGAGSDNVDIYFQEAKQLMTPELREEFERNFGDTYRRKLKSQGVYSKLEEGQVKQMTEEDLPKESRIKPTRYDVIVRAILNRYSRETGERIASGPVAFQLKLTPLAERTVTNLSALLVEQMSTIEFDDKKLDEDKKADVKGNK